MLTTVFIALLTRIPTEIYTRRATVSDKSPSQDICLSYSIRISQINTLDLALADSNFVKDVLKDCRLEK